MSIVVFDPVDFREQYPAYADTIKYTDKYLQGIFDKSTMILSNKANSMVPYDPANEVYDRKILLYLLMCHFLELASSGKVGSLTSASEGSVSAGFYVDQRKGAAWFTQTQCGYVYWQMIQKYKTGGLFVPGAKRH